MKVLLCITILVASGSCWLACLHCLQGLSDIAQQTLRGELNHHVALALEVERIVMTLAWAFAGRFLFRMFSRMLDNE